MPTPQVGVGVIILNQEGKLLLGKRCNTHAPFWALPGGKVELGESFEQTAMREVQEETGLTIEHVQVIGLTNNLQTYQHEGIHFVSAILTCDPVAQTPCLREPHRCEQWRWFEINQLPKPLFEASEHAISNWQAGQFYTRS
ncbi:nucleotide triphosphate diphosphatase NUDT15 [Celerinatantimonas sp. YJH-8]|uniref:nucleotide triphosphate diphosphatase NUDT15 n=1 Tax=Celerinatantimonas sp. YJH-8 TaxID=3228714 RepID=UPI0038C43171